MLDRIRETWNHIRHKESFPTEEEMWKTVVAGLESLSANSDIKVFPSHVVAEDGYETTSIFSGGKIFLINFNTGWRDGSLSLEMFKPSINLKKAAQHHLRYIANKQIQVIHISPNGMADDLQERLKEETGALVFAYGRDGQDCIQKLSTLITSA